MPVRFDARADPWDIATADFNADGRPDLATANRYSRTVSILIAARDGKFRAARTYPVRGRAESIEAADLNGDDRADVAVANYTRGAVLVLISKSDGGLCPAVNYRTGGGPTSVAVGDLNADGRADLAVANYDDVTISTLLGRGDGTFLPATTYRDDALNEVAYVASGDFNEDGKDDVAAADVSGGLWVLIGRGDGTLLPAVSYRAGDTPSGVATRDLNNDRRLDLAVSNVNSSDVSVLLGRGDGTFRWTHDFRVAASYSGTGEAVVTEVNGDDNLDVVAANDTAGNVGLLLGRGDGSFQRVAHYRTGGGYAVAVADLNQDALPDLAVANYSSHVAGRHYVSVLLQTHATPPRIVVSGLPRRGCVSQAIRVRVRVASVSPLQSVSLFVDRARITRTSKDRFSVTVHGERLGAGHHTFRVVAVSRARLEATQRVRFARCR